MKDRLEKPRSFSRRSVLSAGAAGIVAIPLASLSIRGAKAQNLDLPELTVDDPSAKALAYHVDAAAVDTATHANFVAGSNCANCQLYTGGEAELGPCSIFPGKLVRAEGWCRTWVQKAG